MARHKKIIRNAAAAVLTLSLVTGIASAAVGTGTVTASALNLRSGASTATTTLGTVSKGTTVTVLEDSQNGWYKVEYNGQVGYMFSEYLDVVLTDDDAGEDTEAETETVLARVTASLLNVRSGAGTSYACVSQFPCGTVVTVLEQLDGWYKVTSGSVTGYVSSEYLTIVDASALAASASKGAQLVELAMQYLGTPYKYGGASPSGFDCSGFVYYLMNAMGTTVPRTATAQWNAGYTKVSKSDLQPGDLVFFSSSAGGSSIGHVGIYIGNNQFIHSSSPSSGGVICSSLSESYYAARYVGACRVFA